MHKLYVYLVHHNPEYLLDLQEGCCLQSFLETQVTAIQGYCASLIAAGKPLAVITELSLAQMTRPLRPSKFLYLREIIEHHYAEVFIKLREEGTLTLTIVKLLEPCLKTFEQMNFCEENKQQPEMLSAIKAILNQHFLPL